MKYRPPPEVCPVCGEGVPPKSRACPDCGACYESGWREGQADGLDLPDWAYEDEDEKVVRPNLRRRGARDGMNPLWRWVALGMVLALFWYFWEWIYRVVTARWM